ncbi:hypothetical protein LTS15_000837 [Exophiala xenobiotica]|nr:hypothetical protein LTS15_000837 [Exophiala xenobiotica]
MATEKTPIATTVAPQPSHASPLATSASASALPKLDLHPRESSIITIDPSGTTTPPSSLADAALGLAPHRSDDSTASENTMTLRNKIDDELQAFVLAQETPQHLPQVKADDIPTEIAATPSNRRFTFECAFGFTGSFDEPAALPKTKGAFLAALKTEIDGIARIQHGLQAYQHAINSRKYHTFTTDFLIGQNTATIITMDQLDQIEAHLVEVQEEVQRIENDDTEVEHELFEAFRHAQPWVARTRAILIHSHVFYKINFVLACEKNPAIPLTTDKEV